MKKGLKKVALQLTVLMLMSAANLAFSESSHFFSVREDCHVDEPFSVMICLDGVGPLTCMNYRAHATILRIITTIPNHIYLNAGIKSLSSLYTPTNCQRLDNGSCLFSVSDTMPATVVMHSILNPFMVC